MSETTTKGTAAVECYDNATSERIEMYCLDEDGTALGVWSHADQEGDEAVSQTVAELVDVASVGADPLADGWEMDPDEWGTAAERYAEVTDWPIATAYRLRGDRPLEYDRSRASSIVGHGVVAVLDGDDAREH